MGKQRANRRPREIRHHVDEDRKTPKERILPENTQGRTSGERRMFVASSAELKAQASAAWDRGDTEEALRFEQLYRDQLLIEASQESTDPDIRRRQELLRAAHEESWYEGGTKIEDDMRPFFEARRIKISPQ